MLNSKELLERTGISRATLNNYISWGIVPRPEVLPPEPGGGAAPRIGYFPEDVVARIEDIQRLKRDGWSMSRIAEHFGAPPPIGPAEAPADEEPAVRAVPAAGAPARSGAPKLSIEDVAHPAYLVDHNFNVVWFNEAAGAGVLAGLSETGAEAAGRNVFKYLTSTRPGELAVAVQVLRFHLALARQQATSIQDLCRGLTLEEATRLASIYQGVQAAPRELVSRAAFGSATGRPPRSLYALQFREGVLFAYVPDGSAAEEFTSLLAEQGLGLREPGRKRLPVLRHVAVLATDLQDSSRIWAELPADEYFELANQIWVTVDAIFTRHHGAHGKHPGDGLVGYFFPQPDASHLWNALVAARETREAMRGISKQWQLRKGWSTELYMNTGLDEGQQWLGTLRAAGQVEFTMQGAPLNRALRISEFSRSGAIWATKNLVARLAPAERQRLEFGVRRGDAGQDAFVASIFSTVDQLADPALSRSEKLKEIARLPITEIVELAATDTPAGAAVQQAPL